MRSVNSKPYILPFHTRSTAAGHRPQLGPLRRVELHQVEHDEIASLRARLLDLIRANEQARKVSRLRLVN